MKISLLLVFILICEFENITFDYLVMHHIPAFLGITCKTLLIKSLKSMYMQPPVSGFLVLKETIVRDFKVMGALLEYLRVIIP